MADLIIDKDINRILTSEALNNGLKTASVLNMDPAIASFMQQQFGTNNAQIKSVTFAELESLDVVDFTTVFVKDFGGNGKGSMWWKHPLSGWVPVSSNLAMAFTGDIKTQSWHTGDPDPTYHIVDTVSFPAVLPNSRLTVSHYVHGDTGGYYQFSLNYKKKLDDSSQTINSVMSIESGVNKAEFFLSFYTQSDVSYMVHFGPNGAIAATSIPGDEINFSKPFSVDISIKPEKTNGATAKSSMYNAYYTV